MTEQEWQDFLAHTEGHTPGPWFWQRQGCDFSTSFSLSPGVLITEESDGTPGGDTIDQANAALTAAAPTLKDEVIRLREALEGIGVVTDCPKAKHLCRKALKGGEA